MKKILLFGFITFSFLSCGSKKVGKKEIVNFKKEIKYYFSKQRVVLNRKEVYLGWSPEGKYTPKIKLSSSGAGEILGFLKVNDFNDELQNQLLKGIRQAAYPGKYFVLILKKHKRMLTGYCFNKDGKIYFHGDSHIEGQGFEIKKMLVNLD